jgi:hypothetical protein
VVGVLGSQTARWNRRVPEPLALAAALGNPQTLLAPDALHSLAVDLPALAEEVGMSTAITPPRPLAGKLAKTYPQRRVILGEDGLAALS